jgi:acetyl/propionyl-CoA carboxylase alpha subunit
MGAAAVAAARAVGYTNAGTVEFLLEGEGADAKFYFVEMNTRLQVEHPVTELVTGIDLVHAQIRVASGEPLPWSQPQLTQRGHAIECRVYAEDPAQDFLPQAGELLIYREPHGPGIRVDAGVVEGSEVSVFYDPLLAKVIVSAETRDQAIRRAATALRNFVILGIHTNIPYLLAVLDHPRFVKGDIDTGFLMTEHDVLRSAITTPGIPLAAFAAAAVHNDADAGPESDGLRRRAVDPFDTAQEWRN